MRKVITCIGGLALSCAVASTAFAGAVENKTNWSAEYIRTLNRNAATDYADIAAYNPAGTVKLNEGFIINGSIQYLSKKYENNITVGPGTVLGLESDEPSYIPGLFAVYNKGVFSIFGAFSNVGGGGKVDFSQGNVSTLGIATSLIGQPFCPFNPLNPPTGGICAAGPTSQQLTGESYYLGYTLGAAYALNDMFSFSVGLRYVNASKELKASVTLVDATLSPYTVPVSFKQDGDGFGGIFGANIAPNEKLNIGMRYETKTNIDLKAEVPLGLGTPILAGLGIINGVESPRDLPALLGLGASYRITPKLRTEVNLTYYFNENADWNGAEDYVDNGYDVGITLEYIFNEKLTGSVGYMFTSLGMDPEYMLPENPELDANTLGAGIAYAFSEKFRTNFSIGNTFYADDSFVAPPPIEYKKNVFFMALGLEYRFM
jgi:long-chain fatty acid transport protein